MRISRRVDIGADAWVLSGLIVAGACAWLIWLGNPVFPLDDAYIVQHAVESLRGGGESRFIEATPMDGATSPLHVLSIALVSLVMPVALAQAVVAMAGAGAYLGGAYCLARRAGMGAGWAAVMTAIALLAGLTLTQLMNGLETGLAMAGLTWTFVLFWQPRPDHRGAWLLLGVLPFIRPELALWSALLGLRALLAASAADGRGRVQILRDAFMWGGAAAVILAATVLAFGGALLPNTIGAKEAFFAEGCRPVLERLSLVNQIMVGGLLHISLALLAPVLVLASRLRWYALAFMAIFVGVYTLKLPGGFFHNDYRYLHLLMPFAILGLVELVRPQARGQSRIGQWMTLIVLVVAVVGAPEAWSRYNAGLGKTRGELTDVSTWVAANLPQTSIVVVHDAGMASMHGQQKLVDLVGLKTRSSAEVHKTTTFAKCGRDPRAMDRIARQAGATHFVVLRDWDELFALTRGLRDSGWTLLRADAARGDTLYEVYSLSPPIA